jgi:hypothetical protein
MTCWPSRSVSLPPMRRAVVSVEPPAAYGTTMRTGRSGQAAQALVAKAAEQARTASAAGKAMFFICWNPFEKMRHSHSSLRSLHPYIIGAVTQGMKARVQWE